LLPESFAAVENAENKMNRHPDASILHLSGDLHNYLDGLPKNAGQHQLKNGIVQHSFSFLAGGFQLRFSNIPPGRRSESNLHSLAGHYKRDSLTPTFAPWSRPVHLRPRYSR
jgi:hypothetical protein